MPVIERKRPSETNHLTFRPQGCRAAIRNATARKYERFSIPDFGLLIAVRENRNKWLGLPKTRNGVLLRKIRTCLRSLAVPASSHTADKVRPLIILLNS